MKKLFYIFLFAFASAITITACSDEEITPSSELENGGGGLSSDGRN
jgi:hypothetical protein